MPNTTSETTTIPDRLDSGALVLPVWAKPLLGWVAPLLFAFVAFWPAWRRIARPTLLGDDITRIVHLLKLSFVDHLFHPFSNHLAPFFQLVSWLTWQIVGHDIRWASLGFCTASILSWGLVLVLLAYWLARETGSRTASLAAVALVAQSPLALETVYWYSASSFLWAVVFVLIAVIGASAIVRSPALVARFDRNRFDVGPGYDDARDLGGSPGDSAGGLSGSIAAPGEAAGNPGRRRRRMGVRAVFQPGRDRGPPITRVVEQSDDRAPGRAGLRVDSARPCALAVDRRRAGILD